MKTSVLIVIMLLFSNFNAPGQNKDNTSKYSISGTLLSRHNKVPLDFGYITLLNISSGKSQEICCMYSMNFTMDSITAGGLDSGKYLLQVFQNRDEKLNDTIIDIHHSIVNLKVYTDVICKHYDATVAQNDVSNRHPKLLIQGGIAPTINIPEDLRFENKYEVKYRDFGCIKMDDEDCIITYNKTIFKYLDSKYGNKWRKNVRNDVVGLQ